MLVSVGMYLPIETSFAIFVGERSRRSSRRGRGERAENTGTLLASGLIAGEALTGILFAALAFSEIEIGSVFAAPSYLASLAGMVVLGAVLVLLPRAAAARGER